MSHKIIKIGRSVDNDIVLDHPSISRHHAELFYDSHGNVFLTDLNSSNGTFVNGRRISGSVQLTDYDILKLGLSDIIPWRNYILDAGYSQNVIQKQEVHAQPIYDVPKNSGGPWKTITITLSILIAVCLIGFGINESGVLETEPEIIDPQKPNDDNQQPSKKSEDEKKEITYDFSCLEDENDMGTTRVIDMGEKIDSEVTEMVGGEVSIEDEEKLGEDLYNDLKQQYTFIESGKRIENLRALLKRLVDQIPEPKGYHYQIFLLDDDKELNAFTAGAKIYVTKRMYEFCRSNDELACVIGHEINHNELGHIRQYIQKERLLSETGANLIGLLTIAFGQKKETHCDLTGIDLAIAAGYNGCVNIELWRRMKAEAGEGDYDPLENMFRSHPYSEKRADCSRNHISTNYGFDCKTNSEVE